MKASLTLFAASAPPSRMRDQSRQGMALVVTLIMLAVITFMAVTFLVLSRSEKGAVITNTDQTLARMAADASRDRAIAQITASVLSSTNPSMAGLLVSTNFLDTASPIDQRPPVYVRSYGTNDYRYYLDLNRNGIFDPSGWLPEIVNGVPLVDVGGKPVLTFRVGDPQWIGGLQSPDRLPAADNRFLFRYAFLAVPAGQTLDLNHIHNYAKVLDPGMAVTGGDAFRRNQGVGSWEINLAAFLADLNTNIWLQPRYQYNGADSQLGLPNVGLAFDDALSLLRYRYDARPLGGPNQFTLPSLAQLYPVAVPLFTSDLIDSSSMGSTLRIQSDPDVPGRPWPGGFSTNHYFSTQDLFDRTKTARGVAASVVSFSDRLTSAGQDTRNSYNQNTFYRLLSQLGTDSDPVQNKIHLNYRNMDPYGNISMGLVTNYQSWAPVQFFTNVANRMLAQAGYTFDVSTIQLYPTNYYTPSVHRILQLAANIYDATTNSPFPSVFKPIIQSIPLFGTETVFITGYTEEAGTGFLTAQWRDLNNPRDLISINPGDMVIGIPTVIGAKKGLPNFNDLQVDTQVQMTRKLEFRRNGGSTVVETNQMYTLMISNSFGLEAWNSYSNSFPRSVSLSVVVNMGARLTNEDGTVLVARSVTNTLPLTPIAGNAWKGFSDVQRADRDGSLITPFQPGKNDFLFMTNMGFSEQLQRFVPIAGKAFERNGSKFPVPHWWLTLRTQVRFILIDTDTGRLLDFVNLDNKGETYNLADILQRNSASTPRRPTATYGGRAGDFWLTNRLGGSSLTTPTMGILNQIMASAGIPPVTQVEGWPDNATNNSAKTFFKDQLLNRGFLADVFYAPFAPTRDLHIFTSWQANDPLVHYTLGDLTDMVVSNKFDFLRSTTLTNIGRVNGRYQPWGETTAGSSVPTRYDLSLKDPLVRRSDDWNFPTGKFPSVGLLGRVHRGTPWQTVYLKSATTDPGNWMNYAGNGMLVTNYGQLNTNMVPLFARIDDTAMSRPTNDWPLLDIFTTAINEDGMRGQLSVNQTNLAAWSAVLSGVNVLPDLSSSTFIEPAGVYDPLNPTPLARIVEGINRTRASRPDGVFHHLADIAAVPELTVKSPYLSGNPYAMSDEVYERIPQQIIGLLHSDNTPRYVIYSYGQALKPANRSVQGNGICTNYQVTAEMVTRTVVRVDGAPKNPHVVVESFNILPPD